jgi:hypothetical protein
MGGDAIETTAYLEVMKCPTFLGEIGCRRTEAIFVSSEFSIVGAV